MKRLSKVMIEHRLAKIPPSYVEYLPEVRKFTDVEKLLRGGYHTLIFGITGSGKTTLLLKLLKVFLDRGLTILARDDGGLESTFLLPYTPITYWIPEGCKLRVRDSPYKYRVEGFDWRRPEEVLDSVWDSPFNLVVFDAYCIDPGVSAVFWSSMLKTLIFKCMQTPVSRKEKLVFSVDELNDLIQPKGYELSKKHSDVRALIEYNIRKLRKHNVTLVATTHRFTQLGISVRSQFSYVMVKKSFGWDVWDFVSKSLATQNNKVFWSVLKDITVMSPEYAYLFDYKNNFDKFYVEDIQRPKLDVELQGVIQLEDEVQKYKERWLRLAWHMVNVGCPNCNYKYTQEKVANLSGVSQPALNQAFQVWRRSASTRHTPQSHSLNGGDMWNGEEEGGEDRVASRS